MINEAVNKKVITALTKANKKGYGLSLTDINKVTPLSRCQIRTAVAFLLGSEKIEQQKYGMAKIYYIVSEDSQ